MTDRDGRGMYGANVIMTSRLAGEHLVESLEAGSVRSTQSQRGKALERSRTEIFLSGIDTYVKKYAYYRIKHITPHGTKVGL